MGKKSSGMGKKSRSGSWIWDEHPGSYFRELADPDPGSGIFLTLDPVSGIWCVKLGIRDPRYTRVHRGSATLPQTLCYRLIFKFLIFGRFLLQFFICINRKKNPATTYNFLRFFLTQKFHCHKMFLAMSSPVFEAMFYGGLAETAREIKILDVQPDAFAALLDYIYTDQLQLNSFELVCDICYAAKKYMLPDLGKGLLCFLLCKIFRQFVPGFRFISWTGQCDFYLFPVVPQKLGCHEETWPEFSPSSNKAPGDRLVSDGNRTRPPKN
jgi:hypothetical protein